MGTRGAYGFRLDQKDMLMYNHYDSYPEGLGEDFVKFCRKVSNDFDLYRDLCKNLIAVDETVPPTDKQKEIAYMCNTVDLAVSNRSDDDWYCLLRNTQGEPELTLRVGMYIPSNDFVDDSLFCEYAYILNFDTQELEIYEGFNNDPDADGRYVKRKEPRLLYDGETKYYGVKLILTYPLDNIPNDWVKKFERLTKKDDEEE